MNTERNTTHGRRKHPLYTTWIGMMRRCGNPAAPDYGRYGGRGIAVCPEWRDAGIFIAWLEGNLGPRPAGHSLDRINNNRGYEPGNVRWATDVQQVRNSRKAKLTELQVREIKSRYSAGGITQRALAAEYDVSRSAISLVVAGRNWKDVGLESA